MLNIGLNLTTLRSRAARSEQAQAQRPKNVYFLKANKAIMIQHNKHHSEDHLENNETKWPPR